MRPDETDYPPILACGIHRAFHEFLVGNIDYQTYVRLAMQATRDREEEGS